MVPGVNLAQQYPEVNWAEIARLFHILWYTGPAGTPPWETTSWLGVPVKKCPFDNWVYQEIIHRLRPEVIVETGVYYGGSTLYLASMLDLVGSGEVIAVDIDLSIVHAPVRAHPRITLIEGSSTDPLIVARIAAACQGRRTMVILDSDHTAPHVLSELQTYGPLVTPGHYMIVEDSNLNGHPIWPNFGPGPMEAIHEFLRIHHAGWKRDENCERLLMSLNPHGFLMKNAAV